jgi:hypothetical protein
MANEFVGKTVKVGCGAEGKAILLLVGPTFKILPLVIPKV